MSILTFDVLQTSTDKLYIEDYLCISIKKISTNKFSLQRQRATEIVP